MNKAKGLIRLPRDADEERQLINAQKGLVSRGDYTVGSTINIRPDIAKYLVENNSGFVVIERML